MIKCRGRFFYYGSIMKKNSSKHIRLDLVLLIITFGLHTAIELTLSVNSILWTDTLYRDTIFPDILTSLQSLLEMAVISAGLSVLAVVFFMGLKKLPCILVYSGALVYRRLLAMGITLIINGEIALDDIFMSLLSLLLDMLTLLVAILIIYLFSKNYRRRAAMATKASALFGDAVEKPDLSEIYPFTKIYGKGNPLQGCLLALGILLSAVKLITRTVALFVSVPESILLTVGGYASDLLIVVISYALSCLLLSVLYSQNEKRLAIKKLYGED